MMSLAYRPGRPLMLRTMSQKTCLQICSQNSTDIWRRAGTLALAKTGHCRICGSGPFFVIGKVNTVASALTGEVKGNRVKIPSDPVTVSGR